MSGQNNNANGRNFDSRREMEEEGNYQAGSQRVNNPTTSSNLFNPNYRGPQTMGQQGNMYNSNTNASGTGHAAQPYNIPVYNQNQAYGRGYQGRGGLMSPFTQLGGANPQYGYQQPPAAHQHSRPQAHQQFPGRGAGRANFSSPASRGGHRQPAPPPARQPPPAPLPSLPPPAQAHRPASAGRGTKPPPKPFGEEDFPSLGSQPTQQQPLSHQKPDVEHELARQLASHSIEDQAKVGGGGRGCSSRRAKFVPFTDYDPSSNVAEDTLQQQVVPTLPPPRSRRNEAFRISISECYRGKIIFIDELAGIDYSNHPAIVRSINHATKQIRFFKKSSFKGIGGFLNKYGEYVNQAQKKWHEKQWLLVDDGVTKPHHGTPLLKLANGEKMPERGSYVDIHGDSELHIDYFSKYSRYGVFPDIYLPENQMKQLEEYSEWYLEKDEEYRAAEERKKRQKWQMDGSADVDVGDVYEDSENEADGE
ncbi:hypothetical protein BFW01_g8027 [Lasiodiplodia theobromae]|nr:hypothetical protein BFW01_g8027 [Lasiodiplodia theobromae]